jgi:hypothetical protein
MCLHAVYDGSAGVHEFSALQKKEVITPETGKAYESDTSYESILKISRG